MSKTLKLLFAQLFAPLLLMPLAAQAQDGAAATEATEAAQDAERAAARAAQDAERAAARALKEQEKERREQERAAEKLEKERDKEAEKLGKESARETAKLEKARDKETRAAAKAARKRASEGRTGNDSDDAAAALVEVVAPPTPDKASPDNILYLDLSTGGRVSIQLYPEVAPNHVERIRTLARQGFYDGIVFHRVIEGFMAQTGDPTGTGTGGSELPDVAAEFNKFPHLRGTLSMARAQDPNSANSQFFIVFYPRFSLDNSYTNFGRVFAGMEFVDAIPRGEPPTNPARILQASLKSQNKPEPNYAAAAARAPADREISVDDLNAPITN